MQRERKPGPLARAGSTGLVILIGLTVGLMLAATIVHIFRVQTTSTAQLRHVYDVAMDNQTGDTWLCVPAVALRGRVWGAGWITVDVDGTGDRTPSLPAEGVYKPDPFCSLGTLGVGRYSVWRSDPPSESSGYSKSEDPPVWTPWQRT